VKLVHASLSHRLPTILAEGYFSAILDVSLGIQRRSQSADIEGTRKTPLTMLSH
jgi:hypothetical protein